MIGPWILVTGASSGVGYVTAAKLAAAGFRPAVGYHTNKIAAERLAADVGGIAIPLNLLDAHQIEGAIARLSSDGLAGVVLNASPPPRLSPFHQTSTDDLEQQLRVSVIGHHRLMAGLIDRAFRPRKAGVVVGVLTKAMGCDGAPPTKQMSSYIIAKYALNGLLDTAACEYRWLRVEKVYPGFTDTPMLRAFDARFVELLRERNGVQPAQSVAQDIVAKIIGSGVAT